MTSPNTVEPAGTAEPAATAEPPETPPPAAAAPAGSGSRLGWLDVLRGLAALAVVFNHFGYFVPSSVNTPVYDWFNPGDYGVFVFFLISGYIVPGSAAYSGSTRCTCSPLRWPWPWARCTSAACAGREQTRRRLSCPRC
jgi:hypothetical protein